MTKTRAPPDKTSVTQKETGMENIPVTSVTRIPITSNSVKLKHATDTAEVTGAKAEQSTTDSFQPQINTFSSFGNYTLLEGNFSYMNLQIGIAEIILLKFCFYQC